MNCEVFQLKELEVESFEIREVLRCILHTIVFHRALGLIRPKDIDLELFEITYVQCGEIEVEKKIDEKIEQFISWIEKHPNKKSQICVSFYEVKSKQPSWFTNKIERSYWEQWYVNLNVLQPTKSPIGKSHHSKLVMDPGEASEERSSRRTLLEQSLQEVLFQIIKFVNEKKDHVPPINDGVIYCPFEITMPWWNLTANAARPNPQESFHYGKITPTKSFVFSNSAPLINGKQRYAVNGVSYVNSETPLKLADHFNIAGVFSTNAIQSVPSNSAATVATSVVKASLHDFLEIVFQNNEKSVQSWHLDGYDFWVVGFGSGQWTPAKRPLYNLADALTRHTTQVYPNSWTAILVSLDNQGMWNMRSAIWERQYSGQQFYLQVWDPVKSLANEYNPPDNLLLCGKAVRRHL